MQLVFPPSSSVSNTYVQQRGCDYESLFYPVRSDIKVCTSFSNHGHCIAGKKCPQSHDIDQVVIGKEANIKKNERKRKRQDIEDSVESMDTNGIHNETNSKGAETTTNGATPSPSSTPPPSQPPATINCGGHRAGFDAFMTGFSFATFIVHSTLMDQDCQQSEAISRLLGVPVKPDFSDLNIVNRIYLVCKDIPFMIRKSAFSRNSIGHSEKYNFINSK